MIYDVIIVGGGIYGATMAYEAAHRGLKTLLLEKGRLGMATSANSLKIFHGGLRSLQKLDFPLMRQMIHEQRVYRKIAPSLVRPLPAVMPLYKGKIKGKPLLGAALLITNLIGADRNEGVDMKLPAGKTISAAKCKELLPGFAPDNLAGAAYWHDVLMEDCEALTRAFAKAAKKHGADVKENSEVTSIQESSVTVGKTCYETKHIILAAGPWTAKILKKTDINLELDYYKSINIQIKKQLFQVAAGFTPTVEGSEDYGTIFTVPWKGKTIIGCSFEDFKGDPDKWKIDRSQIKNFINYINRQIPKADIKEKDIDHVYAGLLPREKNILMRHHIIKRPRKGLTYVIGVKYTTARWVAEKVVDKMTSTPSHSAKEPIMR